MAIPIKLEVNTADLAGYDLESYGYDASRGRGGSYEPYYYLLHTGRKINIRAGSFKESESIVEALMAEIAYYRARSPALIPPPIYTQQGLDDLAYSAMKKLAKSVEAKEAAYNKSPAQSEKLLLL